MTFPLQMCSPTLTIQFKRAMPLMTFHKFLLFWELSTHFFVRFCNAHLPINRSCELANEIAATSFIQTSTYSEDLQMSKLRIKVAERDLADF